MEQIITTKDRENRLHDELTETVTELTRLRDALNRIATVAAGTWAGNYAEIILDGGRVKK